MQERSGSRPREYEGMELSDDHTEQTATAVTSSVWMIENSPATSVTQRFERGASRTRTMIVEVATSKAVIAER